MELAERLGSQSKVAVFGKIHPKYGSELKYCHHSSPLFEDCATHWRLWNVLQHIFPTQQLIRRISVLEIQSVESWRLDDNKPTATFHTAVTTEVTMPAGLIRRGFVIMVSLRTKEEVDCDTIGEVSLSPVPSRYSKGLQQNDAVAK